MAKEWKKLYLCDDTICCKHPEENPYLAFSHWILGLNSSIISTSLDSHNSRPTLTALHFCSFVLLMWNKVHLWLHCETTKNIFIYLLFIYLCSCNRRPCFFFLMSLLAHGVSKPSDCFEILSQQGSPEALEYSHKTNRHVL